MTSPEDKDDLEFQPVERVCANYLDTWFMTLADTDPHSLAERWAHALVAGEGFASSVGHGADATPDPEDIDLPIVAIRILNTDTDPDDDPIWLGNEQRQEYPIYPMQEFAMEFSNIRNIFLRNPNDQVEITVRILVLTKDE